MNKIINKIKNIIDKISSKNSNGNNNNSKINIEEMENHTFQKKNNNSSSSKIDKKKIIKIISFVVLFLVILIGGMIGYQYYMSKKGDNLINDLSMPMIKKEHSKLTPHKSLLKPSKNLINKPLLSKSNNNLVNKPLLVRPNNNLVNKPLLSKSNNNLVNKPLLVKSNNNLINNKPLLVTKPNKTKPLMVNNSKNDNKKLLIVNNKKEDKKYTENQLFSVVKAPEKLLSKKYLPILGKDTKSKNDVYALTDEDLVKLSDMETYINKKQEYMEKVSQYLNQKQKYLTALKTFDDFNKQLKRDSEKKQEASLRQEMNTKIHHLENIISNNMKKINNNINTIKSKNISVQKNGTNEDVNVIKETNKNNQNIKDFFKNGQIFSMNNEYIIAVNNNGIETVYKVKDRILDNFLITAINTNIITLQKNKQLYFYNIKNKVNNNEFSRIIIQMPAMYDKKLKEDKKIKNTNSTIQEYKTPEQRKKEEAKKFFNLKG